MGFHRIGSNNFSVYDCREVFNRKVARFMDRMEGRCEVLIFNYGFYVKLRLILLRWLKVRVYREVIR